MVLRPLHRIVSPPSEKRPTAPVNRPFPPVKAQNTAYIRPEGWKKSWKILTASARSGSHPVVNQAAHVTALSLLALAATATFSSLSNLTAVVPSLATLLPSAWIYLSGKYRLDQTSEKIGLFTIVTTVAGEEYEVKQPSQDSTDWIEPLDRVVEIHLNEDALREHLKGVAARNIPKTFERIWQEELATHADAIAGILRRSDAKALRGWTILNPKYFPGLEPFEINNVQLDRFHSTSLWKRFLSRLIFTTSRVPRFEQVINNLFFRPWRRLFKTYPTRTYVVPRADFGRFMETWKRQSKAI